MRPELISARVVEQHVDGRGARAHAVHHEPARRRGRGGATPFQSLLPVMLGFREVVASLLWVQADDLFHRHACQCLSAGHTRHQYLDHGAELIS